MFCILISTVDFWRQSGPNLDFCLCLAPFSSYFMHFADHPHGLWPKKVPRFAQLCHSVHCWLTELKFTKCEDNAAIVRT